MRHKRVIHGVYPRIGWLALGWRIRGFQYQPFGDRWGLYREPTPTAQPGLPDSTFRKDHPLRIAVLSY